MKLLIFSLIILAMCAQTSFAREVTNSDIRDAILSLLKIVSSLETKLERHESREKTLGDQIKRSLASLEKGHKGLEPLKGVVSRLDERLSKVETILLQKDEREKQQKEKSDEAMEKLKGLLKTWNDNVTSVVRTEIKGIPQPVIKNDALVAKIADIEKSLSKKVDSISPHTEALIKKAVENINQNQRKEVECKKTGFNETAINKHFEQTQKLLTKLDSKQTEHDAKISKVQKEIAPLSEISAADEAWHSKITNVIEKQNQDLVKIQKSISDAEKLIKAIPTITDIENCSNHTIDVIVKLQSELAKKSEESIMKIAPELRDVKMTCDKFSSIQDNIIQNITSTCNNSSEDTYLDLIQNYGVIKTELQSLPKVERVMLQTSDNVLDTKRRIEYGIHQISLEVSEAVKQQSNLMNNTIYKKFAEIESSIIANQSNAMGNLSKKIEDEISQVWRQVGIMYQQLTASNTVLDRLQAQTEQYVNGTITAMDGMEGKVGLITKRMTDIEQDLNYLLGRLSLVTQEFNLIKDGLGNALEGIKKSFTEVQSKMKDVGPGPHKIEDDS